MRLKNLYGTIRLQSSRTNVVEFRTAYKYIGRDAHAESQHIHGKSEPVVGGKASWFYNYVKYVHQRGLLAGTSGTALV